MRYMETEKKVLTVEELAKELRISRSLAYRQVREGKIYSIKCGDRYLIPRKAFEQLLSGDQQRQEEEFLLRHGMEHAAVEIFSPDSRKILRFFPDGSTPGSNGSISLCGRGGPEHARRLVISNIGRIRRDLFPGINPDFCPA